MTRKKNLLRIFALCLTLCLLFAGCKTAAGTATYTVTVKDQDGNGISNVSVYIYADSTRAGLEYFDTTDADGKITFTAGPSDTRVAVLQDVPEQYSCEAYYPVTGENTEIVLGSAQLTVEDDTVFQLGDQMMDFTVTTVDGKEYNLTELLKNKRAVILNFWQNGDETCDEELSYLQKAYDLYKDAVEVLCINPVDGSADIAAYLEKQGLTMPMVAGDPAWQEMMELAGYPTVVVIDRFGKIAMKHQGEVEDMDSFKQICEFFCSAEYEETTLVQSIEELKSLSNLGTAENPEEIGSVLTFTVTVKPGEEYYVNLFRVRNMYLQVKDSSAYVVYGDKKYEPKNGVVGLTVNVPDNYTPTLVRFGNSGSETKTYTVTLTPPAGSSDNPYTLKLGETTVKIGSGNDQGVHYVYYATESGTLTLECTSATAGVKYDCSLQRVTATNVVVMRSLSQDGADNKISIQVKKGEQVKVIFSTVPNEKFQYSAGTFVYNATFEAGEVTEDEVVETVDYTVSVKDNEGNPVGNVNIAVDVEGTPTYMATSAEGTATVTLPKGTYTATVTVPEGYILENTQFTLSEEAPNAQIVLQVKVIEMVDYVVTVENVYAEPMADIFVVIGSKFATTNEEGKAVINLEKGEYTVTVTAPEGYVTPDAVQFAEGTNELVITLEYIPGSINAPIDVTSNPFTTQSIAGKEKLYFNLRNAGGMILNIADSNAFVIYNGTTYGADTSGVVRVPLEKTMMPMMPITIEVGNAGNTAKTFTMELKYPVGHMMNPKKLTGLGEFATNIPENDESGYYYLWTADMDGTFSIATVSATEGAAYDVSITNQTTSQNKVLSEDATEIAGALNIGVDVKLGDQVMIQVYTVAFDENGEYVGLPEAEIVLKSKFLAEGAEPEKIQYKVNLVDEEGNPKTGVSVQFMKGSANVGNPVEADANGIATAMIVPGDYTLVLTIADETLTYDETTAVVSAADPEVTIVLTKKPVEMLDYTVNLTKGGSAYTGSVTVKIFDADDNEVFSQDTTTGSVTANLEKGSYTVKLQPADNKLIYNEETAILTDSASTLTIELTEKAPEVATVIYSVVVVDSMGKPQSGILVQIMNGSTVVHTAATNADGEVTKSLVEGNYKVNLMFSGTSYYYNQAAAVLTPSAPNLSIVLAEEPKATTSDCWIVNNAPMYILDLGTTHLQIGTDKAYYSAEYGMCFFAFIPSKEGNYRVYLDNTAVELYKYGMLINPWQGASASSSADNALHYSVLEGQPGNLELVLGIEVASGVTDVAITIVRDGDVELNMHTAPWTEYVAKHTPSKFTLTEKGTQTYVDITSTDASKYTLVYNSTDKFYHLGSENGPVVYMNLALDAPYVTLNTMINGDGTMGGAPLRKYFFDSNGNFVKKEDYTNLMSSYISAADTKTGLYPLTEDLMYMVQNAGAGWWTEGDPNFIMTGANPELGWLFACCYFE